MNRAVAEAGNTVRKTAISPGGVIDWTDIGRFAEAISFARRELFAPVEGIRDRHRLGPRGIWIIGVISSGRVRFQSDIAKLWQIGRSMVTEEIAPLVRAGLVMAATDEADRRQIRLALTDKGRAVNEELGNAFSSLINQRLAGYGKDEIELCIDMLYDLSDSGNRKLFTR